MFAARTGERRTKEDVKIKEYGETDREEESRRLVQNLLKLDLVFCAARVEK